MVRLTLTNINKIGDGNMGNSLQTWDYCGCKIRTLEKDGEPWWVLSDVCKVLELSSPHKVADRLEADEKGRNLIPTPGGMQEMTTINESGLYAVILRSDKPQAKPFRKWVTSEVLPSIRKHGAYMTEQTLERAVSDPDFLIQIANQIKEEQAKNKALTTRVLQQDQQIKELKPKADYTDSILKSKSLVTITQIAKDYGMSGNRMNDILHDLGIQYKLARQWLLYAKYQSKGYTHSETVNITHTDGRQDVRMNTKWTQKGRLFLYEVLKNAGIFPLIERKEE